MQDTGGAQVTVRHSEDSNKAMLMNKAMIHILTCWSPKVLVIHLGSYVLLMHKRQMGRFILELGLFIVKHAGRQKELVIYLSS
jgi:hypothetical protein